MSHYGFEIVQTLIVDIEPDEHVKRAMNEINAGMTLYSILLTFSVFSFFFFFKWTIRSEPLETCHFSTNSLFALIKSYTLVLQIEF